MKPRMRERYETEIVPVLMKESDYGNVMRVPRLQKVVVNMGVSGANDDRSLLDNAIEQLGMIIGQRPAITRARKSIANFKIRQGMAIGCRVTLRGARMYEFLDRLVSIALPRIRDFRGLPENSFDGHGNYSMGITEQTIFPEIPYDKVDRVRGMDVTIVTTAPTDEEAEALLRALGFPIRSAA